ncbi:hypothetical protein BV25DRAFT_330854 [Artomyces pyxidatus]|uniref:Uncharacterized protein n=1 Tax=Artomyces pyxidatus TaxID=48021 RepID=A0ACB8T7M5_9AGAM|nr:hypothetical protein BV25DRAFT_330854 [Artomyces pyxidatus]
MFSASTPRVQSNLSRQRILIQCIRRRAHGATSHPPYTRSKPNRALGPWLASPLLPSRYTCLGQQAPRSSVPKTSSSLWQQRAQGSPTAGVRAAKVTGAGTRAAPRGACACFHHHGVVRTEIMESSWRLALPGPDRAGACTRVSLCPSSLLTWLRRCRAAQRMRVRGDAVGWSTSNPDRQEHIHYKLSYRSFRFEEKPSWRTTSFGLDGPPRRRTKVTDGLHGVLRGRRSSWRRRDLYLGTHPSPPERAHPLCTLLTAQYNGRMTRSSSTTRLAMRSNAALSDHRVCEGPNCPPRPSARGLRAETHRKPTLHGTPWRRMATSQSQRACLKPLYQTSTAYRPPCIHLNFRDGNVRTRLITPIYAPRKRYIWGRFASIGHRNRLSVSGEDRTGAARPSGVRDGEHFGPASSCARRGNEHGEHGGRGRTRRLAPEPSAGVMRAHSIREADSTAGPVSFAPVSASTVHTWQLASACTDDDDGSRRTATRSLAGRPSRCRLHAADCIHIETLQ